MKRALAGPSFTEQLLLDAVVDIQQNPDATEAAFMARQLVQCTLPHQRSRRRTDLDPYKRKPHPDCPARLRSEDPIKRSTLMAPFPGCYSSGLSQKPNGRRAGIYAWAIAWIRSCGR